MERAEKLSQIRRYFKGQPLSLEELDRFHVPTTMARGKNPTRRLEILLLENAGTHQKSKILFSGYRGCGKSTELNLLHSKLEKDFLVINYSVLQELDQMRLHFIDLFIVTIERLFHTINNSELKQHISEDYLKSIQQWTQSKEVQEIKDKHFTLEAEAGAGFDINYIANFFAKFKAATKTSRSMRETINQNIEPKLRSIDLLE